MLLILKDKEVTMHIYKQKDIRLIQNCSKKDIPKVILINSTTLGYLKG